MAILFGTGDLPDYPRRRRQPSYQIQPEDVPTIKRRILDGDFLNRIAADYDVNPGRISEIKSGLRFAEIPAAPGGQNG